MTEVSVSTLMAQDSSKLPELEAAGIDPGEELGGPLVAADGHVEEDDDREQPREAQERAGNDLRGPVADPAAEKAGDDRPQEGQEDDGDVQGVHARSQPFIMLMSSTSIEPRLRK
jgi:hypothetical protein